MCQNCIWNSHNFLIVLVDHSLNIVKEFKSLEKQVIWRSYKIVFYTLVVCDHYFVQCPFMEVSITQKHPSRGVIQKSCSEIMKQIYRRTPMPTCDFNHVALQLDWNHTFKKSHCIFSEHLFLRTPQDGCFWLCINFLENCFFLPSVAFLSFLCFLRVLCRTGCKIYSKLFNTV